MASTRSKLDEIVASFATLEDPRSHINRRHPLPSVLVIAVLAGDALRVGRIDEWHVDFRNVLSCNTLWRILRLINRSLTYAPLRLVAESLRKWLQALLDRSRIR